MDKKIKIFFCEMWADGTVGGSHSILFNLLKGIDKTVFDPTVGFFSENIYVDKLRELNIKVKILNEFKTFSIKPIILQKLLNSYVIYFKKVKYFTSFFKKKKFDIIVLNNTLYTAEPYIIACKILNIPIVIHERGTNVYTRLQIMLSKHVAASIAMSMEIFDTLIKQKLRSKKIVMVYDGIERQEYANKESTEDIHKELNLPTNSKIIGMVGNIRKWKGQIFFSKAMVQLCREYENLYGIIVGGWREKEDKEYVTEIRECISTNGLEHKILLTGYRTDVPKLLSMMNIFVHASIKPEPFGMVVVEAMAAKIPIVSTITGGPKESLDNGNCGILVSPGDSEEIAKACNLYLENPLLCKEMVERAYNRYCDHFLLRKSIERITKVYIECLLT